MGNVNQTNEKVAEFYAEYADHYSEIYEDYFENKNTKKLIETIGESIKGKQNVVLLDLGCGEGKQLCELKTNNRNIIKAIGVDISDKMIEKAKKNDIKYIKGDFLTDETKNKIIKEMGENKEHLLITCLGNTLGHIPPNQYKTFAEVLNNLLKGFKGFTIFLEIRDGKTLREKHPLFEIHKFEIKQQQQEQQQQEQQQQEEVNFTFIYYRMYHPEEDQKKDENEYPAKVFLIKKEGNELTIKEFYNDVSYYVDVEELKKALHNITKMEVIEYNFSALYAGKTLQFTGGNLVNKQNQPG